jgi:hypothetical protein
MKRISALLAIALVATPMTAFAQQTRLSDAHYLAASQCLAYADVQQLQGDGDFSGLRQAVRVGYRNQDIASQARDAAQRTRLTTRSLLGFEGGIDEARAQRDAACASFVQTGLVQLNSGTSAGAQ